MQRETDVAIIGGGLVGIALGYGLALEKVDTIVLDEGDGAVRASRGNFGLVWVQGKGLALPAYTGWAMRAVDYWPRLARELQSQTQIDVGLSQNGGLFFCSTPETLAQRAADLAQVKANHNGPYDYEILDNAGIRKLVPEIGPNIAGASYSKYDGQANPIRLLHAFHRAYAGLGGRYLPGHGVVGIEQKGDRFVLTTPNGQVVARRIALASGLGNAKLGSYLGTTIPVMPVRGQIMVTERVPPIFHLAMEQIRQTEDGTLMIGTSWEDVGYDLNTTFDVTCRNAGNTLDLFPFLSGVRVIRSWAALRIISPDAAPIYEEIVPNAFLVTCHSGVSLAAIHAFEMAKWIADGGLPAEMKPFGLERFAAHEETAKSASLVH